MHGHAEPTRYEGAVAPVAVEQLDDAGGLAELTHAIVEPVDVEDVEEPDPAVAGDSVRGALEVLRLVGLPAEAALELVHDPHGRAG